MPLGPFAPNCRMRPTWSAFAVTLAALTFSSPLRAQAPQTSVRFRDPGAITGDPTGMRLIPPIGIYMPYPDAERAAEHTAFPVVAFVVDTTESSRFPRSPSSTTPSPCSSRPSASTSRDCGSNRW